ncbi:PASTA domain-containing protein [Tessaracoccus sp. HDW20]|uniref:PASTA domain-containing protein n=1 Tax=Tessaracoccus coleopterorum TaxID=2714950 RepID=UPI0018D3D66E|nr:PASTA domain-containing protein [Tessaracoccus coleopterorum]NHB85413.1 PASTA domain-containing protein [Tessaracoccus coleopterorum]
MAGIAMIGIDKTHAYYKNHRKSLDGIRVNGGRLNGSGGGDAGKIWKAAMKSALKDKPKTRFTAPSKTILEGVKVNVPSIKGMGISEAEKTLQAAGFGTAKRYVYSSRGRAHSWASSRAGRP